MIQPRKFWQIHLSTTVTIMVLYGAFAALNIRRPRVIPEKGMHCGRFVYEPADPYYLRCWFEGAGWPFAARERFELRRDVEFQKAEVTAEHAQRQLDLALDEARYPSRGAGWFLDWYVVIYNVAICSAITGAVGVFIEWRARIRDDVDYLLSRK